MKDLAEFIKSQINISHSDLEIIVSNFEQRTLAKGKYVLKAGQVATAYYFIQSGGLRIYFNKNGKQFTGWLAFENEFFTELSSYKSGQSSLFTIQAIEPTTLLTIDKIKMELLYEQFPGWHSFSRKIWETAFLKVIDGILSHQTMTAEERYLHLMKESDLLQRVPLKELSSYLGVTQTSLSRLRKNIK